ncbi:MAG: monofunctional biosynthetic peptidoglycan transglycosylase [Saprospiraceae bacterium]
MKHRLVLWMRYFKIATVAFVTFSVAWVALYRCIPPPITYVMVSKYGINFDYSPKSIESISPEMLVCAMAAEDQMLPFHAGLDISAIKTAIKRNKKSKKTFGASTITQQVSKNAFLFPNRNFIRKGLELYFSIWVETLWPKNHILNTYLNIAEMGKGIFGAEAAGQHFYKKKASQLNLAESSSIIATLPNPIKFKATSQSEYVLSRKSKIMRQYGFLDGRHYLRELYVRTDKPIYDFSNYQE